MCSRRHPPSKIKAEPEKLKLEKIKLNKLKQEKLKLEKPKLEKPKQETIMWGQPPRLSSKRSEPYRHHCRGGKPSGWSRPSRPAPKPEIAIGLKPLRSVLLSTHCLSGPFVFTAGKRDSYF
jgi:hypothetical protein